MSCDDTMAEIARKYDSIDEALFKLRYAAQVSDGHRRETLIQALALAEPLHDERHRREAEVIGRSSAQR